MITPKRQKILLIIIILLAIVYILRLKTLQITALEDQIDELQRKNQLLRIAHNQALIIPSNLSLYSSQSAGNASKIQLPTIIDIYPHLRGTKDWESLNPALRYPDKQLPTKQLIMGIPTVQRDNKHNASYIIPTINELLRKARREDLEKMRIIVMIADKDGASSMFVQETVAKFKEHFNEYFEAGLLQVIVPPVTWYPDIRALTPTLNDTADRMYWRTKQNLDFAYLMIYAARMGDLYLQLEDDIEAAQDYTGTVLKYAELTDWFLILLSTLGYIGKLMRSSDIQPLAVHILINYYTKPIDWLLDDHCRNRFCSHGMNHTMCVEELDRHRIHVKPAVFQHMGYYSSLKGKIQKAKDKTFKAGQEKVRGEQQINQMRTNVCSSSFAIVSFLLVMCRRI